MVPSCTPKWHHLDLLLATRVFTAQCPLTTNGWLHSEKTEQAVRLPTNLRGGQQCGKLAEQRPQQRGLWLLHQLDVGSSPTPFLLELRRTPVTMTLAVAYSEQSWKSASLNWMSNMLPLIKYLKRFLFIPG